MQETRLNTSKTKSFKWTDFTYKETTHRSFTPIIQTKQQADLKTKTTIRLLKEKKTQEITKILCMSTNYLKVYDINPSKTAFRYKYSTQIEDPKRLIDWEEDPYTALNQYTGEMIIAEQFKTSLKIKPLTPASEIENPPLRYFRTNINNLREGENLKIDLIAQFEYTSELYPILKATTFYQLSLNNNFVNSSLFYLTRYSYGEAHPGLNKHSFMLDVIRRRHDSKGRCVRSVFELLGWKFDSEHLKRKLEADCLLVKDRMLRRHLVFNFKVNFMLRVFQPRPDEACSRFLVLVMNKHFLVMTLLDLRCRKILRTTYISVYEIWNRLSSDVVKRSNEIELFNFFYSFNRDQLIFEFYVSEQDLEEDMELAEEEEEEREEEMEEGIMVEGQDPLNGVEVDVSQDQSLDNEEYQIEEERENREDERLDPRDNSADASSTSQIYQNVEDSNKILQEGEDQVPLYSDIYNRTFLDFTVKNVFDRKNQEFGYRRACENKQIAKYDNSTFAELEEARNHLKITLTEDSKNGSEKLYRINKKSNNLTSLLSNLIKVAKVDNNTLFFQDKKNMFLVDLKKQQILDKINISGYFDNHLEFVEACDDLVFAYDKWELSSQLYRIDPDCIRLIKEIDFCPIFGELGKRIFSIKCISFTKPGPWTALICLHIHAIVQSEEYKREKLVAFLRVDLLSWAITIVSLFNLEPISSQWDTHRISFNQDGSANILNNDSYSFEINQLDTNFSWSIKKQIIFYIERNCCYSEFKNLKLLMQDRHSDLIELLQFDSDDRREDPTLIGSCETCLNVFKDLRDSCDSKLIWLYERGEEGDDNDLAEGGSWKKFICGYDWDLNKVYSLELDSKMFNERGNMNGCCFKVGDRPILKVDESLFLFDFEKRLVTKVDFDVRDQFKLLTELPNRDLVFARAVLTRSFEAELPNEPCHLFKMNYE